MWQLGVMLEARVLAASSCNLGFDTARDTKNGFGLLGKSRQEWTPAVADLWVRRLTGVVGGTGFGF